MLISLGSGVSLQFGDNLTFVSGNGIIELQSTPEYANEVIGSIMIIKPEETSQYEPDFTLSAPTEICSTGSFDIQTGDLQGFGRGSVNIEWDIQTEPVGTEGANIPRLKAILLDSFKGSKIFQIPASLVISHNIYASNSNYLFAAILRHHILRNRNCQELPWTVFRAQNNQFHQAICTSWIVSKTCRTKKNPR